MNINSKNIFFLGIGGIGMSALARFFKSEGMNISGYDLTKTPLTQALEEEEIDITYTDEPQLLNSMPDFVVYTPAIPKENLLLKFFIEKQIKLIKRAVILGEISKNYFTIAVAGTHGKTTITSIIAHILKYNNIDVTAFVGGVCKNYNSNLILSKPTKIIVVEADEFDRSFLTLNPDIAVISSMDADHLDIYGSKEYLEESFNLFANQIKPSGYLYAYDGLKINNIGHIKKFNYSVDSNTDIEATNLRVESGRSHFLLRTEQKTEIEINSFLPGIHNAANLSVAASICSRVGISNEGIAKAIDDYQGVQRRFDLRIANKNHIYVDDYAHHPEEIKATIKALRMLFPDKKLTAIFQPHLFSRTRDFAAEFAASLSLADELLLMEIYPAREKPMQGITSEWLLSLIANPKKQMTSFETVVNDVLSLNPELVLTIGAGSIDRIVEPLEIALS
jgi:UDP-N-acetylmuramate--alanine ligase